MFTWVYVNRAPAIFNVLFQGHREMILFKLFPYFKAASSSYGRTLLKIKANFFCCFLYVCGSLVPTANTLVDFVWGIILFSHIVLLSFIFSTSKKFCRGKKSEQTNYTALLVFTLVLMF